MDDPKGQRAELDRGVVQGEADKANGPAMQGLMNHVKGFKLWRSQKAFGAFEAQAEFSDAPPGRRLDQMK